MPWDPRLNVKESIRDKSRPHESKFISLPRFGGEYNLNSIADNAITTGLSIQRPSIIAENKSLENSEVNDDMSKSLV